MELTELMEQSGLGSHPEMIRLFVKLAPLVREGGAPLTHRSSAAEVPLEDRLYGRSN
jgi:hypothetical protein